MYKIRNIIIYVLVCGIILLSFKMPEILLEMEKNNISIAVYEKEKMLSNIDVEAEKIYLVKAIHEIEEGRTVVISNNKQMLLWEEMLFDKNTGITTNIKEEISKLEESEILKEINLKKDTKCIIGVVNKSYPSNENTYILRHVIMQIDGNEYILNVESKTGKILYITFNKSNLYNVDNKEQILKNYIEYLNLFVINDWKYEIDKENKSYIMKSEKADIKVSLTETSENYVLSLHVVDKVEIIDTN